MSASTSTFIPIRFVLSWRTCNLRDRENSTLGKAEVSGVHVEADPGAGSNGGRSKGACRPLSVPETRNCSLTTRR